MKKQYTKKQITEAIKHWKGVLRKMNESNSSAINCKSYSLADIIQMNIDYSTPYGGEGTHVIICERNKIDDAFNHYIDNFMLDDDMKNYISSDDDFQQVKTNLKNLAQNIKKKYSSKFDHIQPSIAKGDIIPGSSQVEITVCEFGSTEIDSCEEITFYI